MTSSPARAPCVLVLDAVQDPGNVGTMLRTAFALGAAGVVALPGTADLTNPKVLRGSMGAFFRLPMRRHRCGGTRPPGRPRTWRGDMGHGRRWRPHAPRRPRGAAGPPGAGQRGRRRQARLMTARATHGAWAFPLHPAPSRSTWRWLPGFSCTRYCVATDGLGVGFFVHRGRLYSACSSAVSSTSASCAGARAEGVGSPATFALPEVRPPDRLVRQHPGALLARPRGPVVAIASQPISPMYPLVELATALIWAGFVWKSGPTIEALRGAVFFTLLLGILVTDARAYIIPDEFTIGGFVWPSGSALHLDGGAGRRTACVLALAGARSGSACSGEWVRSARYPQAGCDGRWRHQDDGDGRRVRRLDRRAAHHLPRGARSGRSSSSRFTSWVKRSLCHSASSWHRCRRRISLGPGPRRVVPEQVHRRVMRRSPAWCCCSRRAVASRGKPTRTGTWFAWSTA